MGVNRKAVSNPTIEDAVLYIPNDSDYERNNPAVLRSSDTGSFESRRSPWLAFFVGVSELRTAVSKYSTMKQMGMEMKW